MTDDRRMPSGAVLGDHQPRLVPTLAELLADPMRGRDLAPEQAAGLLVALASVQRALELALTAPALTLVAESRGDPGTASPPQTYPGCWLTPEQAAEVCGVSKRQVYSWSRLLEWRPFVRRLSRKALRIEERGLRRWLDSRCAVEALARRR